MMILFGSYNMKQKGSSEIVPVALLRAARALLGWSQTDLAERSGLSLPTIKRIESESGPAVSDEAKLKVQRALRRAGITFIDTGKGGFGVRVRNQ
jgi:transcriptional regulator with XRE-family HTH domain